MRNTGSWRAAGPAQGQEWAAGQPPYGPGAAQAAGGWQAGGWPTAGPAQPNPGFQGPGSPDPGAGQGQGWAGGPGPAGQNTRNTGSWQAAGPQQGNGWVPGAGGFGPGQAGPGPGGAGQGGAGQFGAGQFGAGARNTGSWQAAGPQQYSGQPYAGPPQPDAAGGPGMRNTGGFSRAGGPVIRQRDSALPDPPAGPPGPKAPIAAIENDNVAAFARDLRVLRSKVGLDYPDMAEKSHYTMRTLASAAGGLRLPTLPVLIAYVNACGGDVADWEERWGRLTRSGKKGPTALPAGEQEPGAQRSQGPIPPGARTTGEIYVITSAKQREGW